ncbi:hypothetical protein sS8_4072 [Methylocaldum marinum]|uniref:Uncharacterized protein n=1 Tax=Methylocaldum marinum TaxID=1432792 RepID=A0A250KWN2_9GAMM|nr:hypothetical protein [Methylocaldum marinum]BBA36002.1 hypothetical protein sS8_4072 [Methylocaldum marinum]
MPSHNKEDKLEEIKEKLLDPFEPVFPMPGMWHFSFAMILALVAFFGSIIVLLDFMYIDPKVQFFVIVGAAFSFTAVLVASVMGYMWATNTLRFVALSPVVIVVISLFDQKDIGVFTLVLVVFTIVAIVLMLSKSFRALINILAIRRHRIREMKKDGTYKGKLTEARRRWKIK